MWPSSISLLKKFITGLKLLGSMIIYSKHSNISFSPDFSAIQRSIYNILVKELREDAYIYKRVIAEQTKDKKGSAAQETKQWQEKWHEFNTLCSNHSPLHIHIKPI